MTTLTIRISTQDTAEAAGEAQEIEVTHLLVSEAPVRELLTAQAVTPGLVVLLSQFENYTLIINDKTMLLTPGLAHLLRGDAQWRLARSSMREADMSAKATVLVMQVNARINQALTLQDLLPHPLQLDPAASEEIERLYGDLTHDRTTLILPTGAADVMRNLVTARLVTVLLGAAGIGRQSANEKPPDPQLVTLKRFIFEHLAANPSGDAMARHMGMSRAALYRWATPHLGASPVHYLRALRLEKAQELLRNTMLSLDDIAENTGFSSRYHLSKEFTRQYQMAPARMRRTGQSHPENELFAKVDQLIRINRYDEALELCNHNLRLAGLSEATDRLRYQQALCLQALGRLDEAVAVWESLEHGARSYAAGKQLCGLYFRRASYERAAERLAALYPAADESQQRELLLIWCHQVSELINRRLTPPLPRYLELRRELFPDNLRGMALTAEVLFGLGQEHRTAELCPRLRHLCFYSLRRAGFYRRAIAEYGGDMSVTTVWETLLRAGEYAKVLALAADAPWIMVTALTQLGRAKEAIRRYPEHCQEAYLALGLYQELLERWPAPSDHQIQALAALNRTQALRHYPKVDNWLWGLAQLQTDPANILHLPNADPQLYHLALLGQALQQLSGGNPAAAAESLAKIPLVRSPHFWWPDRADTELVLTTVIRGLLGQREVMQAELTTLRDQHQHTDHQVVWHNARFLLGDINAKQYLRQPCQARVEQRLALVSALDQDLKGSRRKAVQGYRAFADAYKNNLLSRPQLRQFLAWRTTGAK